MGFYIKLVSKGRKNNKLYSIVVMQRKIGITGTVYAKLGYVEKLRTGVLLFRVNKAKLEEWLLKGAQIKPTLGLYLLKVL